MSPLLPGMLLFALFGSADDTPGFSTADAAECAAAYAETLHVMGDGQGVPVAVYRRMKDGLAVWEYELSASAPEADPATLKAATRVAAERLWQTMPDGEDGNAAKARGHFLTQTTGACASKVKAAYDGKPHPVIPFLREAEVSVSEASARSR